MEFLILFCVFKTIKLENIFVQQTVIPDTVKNVSEHRKFKKLTKKYLVDLYK